MGLFGPDRVEVEYVLSRGVIWPVAFDRAHRVFIDVDYDVDVVIDEACVGGWIYPAWVDDDGQLRIQTD